MSRLTSLLLVSGSEVGGVSVVEFATVVGATWIKPDGMAPSISRVGHFLL